MSARKPVADDFAEIAKRLREIAETEGRDPGPPCDVEQRQEPGELTDCA